MVGAGLVIYIACLKDMNADSARTVELFIRVSFIDDGIQIEFSCQIRSNTKLSSEFQSDFHIFVLYGY